MTKNNNMGYTHEFESKFVEVSPNLTIHYVEAGEGISFLLLPGYCSSTEYFKYQLEYFSQFYRVIAYDNRATGLSSQTLDGHHFHQYAEDLKNFMDALGIKDAIIFGQSSGTLVAYALVRRYGTSRIKAFIAGDQWMPRIYQTKALEKWAYRGRYIKETVTRYHQIVYAKETELRSIVGAMLVKDLDVEEWDLFDNMLHQTPNVAAGSIWLENGFVDYLQEAILLHKTVPSVYFLEPRKAYEKYGLEYIEEYIPKTKVEVMEAGHMMHWEFHEDFNQRVHQFLQEASLLRND